MSRIGVFGSSFDPPHLAHLAIARVALGWGLDEVWWIPAAIPPHKRDLELASAWDRFAMCVLATQDEPQMRVDPIELERGGVSYTVDTLSELHARHPHHEWFLMIGEDNWLTLGSWHQVERLPELASFMVFGREDQPPGPEHPFPDLPAVVHFPAFVYRLSSREIRLQIAADDRSWTEAVAPPVAGYIRRSGLYGALPLIDTAPISTLDGL